MTIGFISNLLNAAWVKTTAPDKEAYCFAAIGSTYFTGLFASGVYKSTDNGSTWNPANTGIELLYVRGLQVNGTNLIAGTSDGVYVSSNDGGSWTARNTGLRDKEVYSLLLIGTKLFAGTKKGIFLSMDEGVSWTAVNNGLDTTSAIAAIVSKGSNIFAGTVSGVFKSGDNGASWTKVITGMSNKSIGELAVSGSTLFAGGGFNFYMSTDDGSNWTYVNLNQSISSLMVSGGKIFAGTGEGLFVSSNNGATWKANNDGFGPVYKNVIAMAVIGTDIFASTGSMWEDIWKRPISEMTTGIQELSGGSMNLAIYPNPNPGKFILTGTGNIERVSIQNIFGETIFTMPDLSSGISTEIDLTEFSKGLYFIFFSQNGQDLVKKVIID